MITQTALAAHLGVSKMTVSRAVKRGRLTKCVIRDEHGEPVGIESFESAAAEWAANSDYTDAPQRLKSPTGASGDDPASIVARKNHYQAELARLKFEAAEGLLIDASEAQAGWIKTLSQVRDRLLAVPGAFRQERPHLAPADLAGLEQLIREALTELSEARE